ncbi:ROK family protein [Saccharopolyspora halophila]|uniref:ROK family protein n=1 Tax=Saccharopolyspora halophila TaxID=405551 RepID=UPI0031DC4B90
MASQSTADHRAAILALAGTSGSLSRTDISQRLDLSAATVTQVTKELISDGLLEERASAPSRGGRPAQILGLAGSPRRALGVKIAPDRLAISDVELDGTVRDTSVHDFDPSSADALGNLTDVLREVIDGLDGNGSSLLGIGLGVPGGVHDPAEGIVNADILGWRGVPLGRRLRSNLGLPVLVDNDVNALAAADCLYGRGRQHRDFLIVTIGAGIGAAIVASDVVYRGAHGDAGELGHTPVDPNGPQCVCGNYGCLEAIIGDRALVAAAQRDGVLAANEGISAIHAAADRGDQAAQQILRNAGDILGRSVAHVVNLVDPETVAIYGEGTTAWQHWRPGFEPALRAHLPSVRNSIPVEIDRSDDQTWTQGAAALVIATPFDTTGATREQGRQIRARLTCTNNLQQDNNHEQRQPVL